MASYNTIGVVSPTLNPDYFGFVLMGIQEVAQAANMRLLIVQGTLQDIGMTALSNDCVDGWIVVVVIDGIEQFLRDGKPCVTVAAIVPGMEGAAVSADNYSGTRAAVEHLIDHGYRRIGFVGYRYYEDIQQRYQSYCETLAARGIPLDPALIFDAPADELPGGRVVGQALLDAGMPCDALFAATDENAIGIMEVLQAKGHRIPDDLAIVSFDNIGRAQHTFPPLTTVSQRPDAIGRVAARMLLDQIAGCARPTSPTYITTALVVRRTCGCRANADIPATPDQSNRQSWQDQLARQMVQLLIHPLPLDPNTQPTEIWPHVMILVDGVTAALEGSPAPSLEEIEHAWKEAVQHTVDIETLYALFKALERAAREHQTHTDLQTQDRVEQFLSQAHQELLRSRLAHDMDQINFLNSRVEDNYQISIRLLGTELGRATQLEWLHLTPVIWGCLGLWDSDHPNTLTVVGVYSLTGDASALIGQRFSARSFPPHYALPAEVHDGAAVVTLLPIRSDTFYSGVLVLCDTLENQISSHRLLMWATLLQVALDHQALLDSLSRQQQELRTAYDQQAALLKLVRFLQHELRGYTAGLEGVSPMVRRMINDPNVDEQEQEMLLGALDETVGQMNELVQRILILSREGTISVAQQQSVGVESLLDQTRVEAYTTALRHDLDLTIQLEVPSGLQIQGDPLFLSLALFTAVRNAIESLAHCRLDGTAQLMLRADAVLNTVQIEIADNGSGFPEPLLAQQEEISRSGGNLLTGWSTKSGGSGLGMPLIERVARLHGGHMRFGNHPDRPGAWVRITLPALNK